MLQVGDKVLYKSRHGYNFTLEITRMNAALTAWVAIDANGIEHYIYTKDYVNIQAVFNPNSQEQAYFLDFA